MKVYFNYLLKYSFLTMTALSASLLFYLCITNHKYTYFLCGIPINSNWANILLLICLLCSFLIYRRSNEWKANNRFIIACLSFIFLPFQWLGVHIAAIEYGLKEEFSYRFNIFRIARLWSTDEKLTHAISFAGKNKIAISNEKLYEIITSNNSFLAIDSEILNYYLLQQTLLQSNSVLETEKETFMSWVSNHPYIAAAVVVGVIITVGGLVYLGLQNYQHKIEVETKTLEIDKQMKELYKLLEQPNITRLEVAERLDKLEKIMGQKESDLIKAIKNVTVELERERSGNTETLTTWKMDLAKFETRLKELENTAKTVLQQRGSFLGGTGANVNVNANPTPPASGPVRLSEQNMSELKMLRLKMNWLESKVGTPNVTNFQGETISLSAAVRLCLERILMLRNGVKEIDDEVTANHLRLESTTITALKSILKFLLLDGSISSEEVHDINNNNSLSELLGETNVTQEQLREQLKEALKLLISLWSKVKDKHISKGVGNDD
jgi:hypothetical protein